MTPDHVVFRLDCPPLAFPGEVRCYIDGAVMLAGVRFFRITEDPGSADILGEAWPAILAECRRIFGDGWRA